MNLLLYAFIGIPHMGFWQMLVGVAGLWLFGAYVERRLGSPAFLGIYILLAVVSGFLIGALDGESGSFVISLVIPVLLTGILHLALAPKSRILVLVPIPFAMGFFEVPTIAMLIGWAVLEFLLAGV
ncbi:MAG: rhomboid family intramembrane serine protease [Solirubrobacterales bacterium]